MALYSLLPLLGGLCLPFQSIINGHLARATGSRLGAAWISFLVGSVALTFGVLWRRDLPSPALLWDGPLWHWAGGLLGVVFIASAAASAPRLGAVTFMMLVLAGQVLGALAIDTLGLLGQAAQPVMGWRLVGVVLLIAGVLLVRLG